MTYDPCSYEQRCYYHGVESWQRWERPSAGTKVLSLEACKLCSVAANTNQDLPSCLSFRYLVESRRICTKFLWIIFAQRFAQRIRISVNTQHHQHSTRPSSLRLPLLRKSKKTQTSTLSSQTSPTISQAQQPKSHQHHHRQPPCTILHPFNLTMPQPTYTTTPLTLSIIITFLFYILINPLPM